ncbi:hypothetical protein BV22DRAFT_385331 [Leucogyrophana mollusca]|uniref:Uncharacterized protein n=1 Tax=Leucogyrophana mollusca TaxID=85980 RepID=A0ACB8BKI5_9AGAM|nr:hypothetical protein BV22DRAFT_385331 [Leucogyrophana mollusca]
MPCQARTLLYKLSIRLNLSSTLQVSIESINIVTASRYTGGQIRPTYSHDFSAVATGAVVMYDQVLNFSQEVDHIWNRRWGPTTALYLVARYSGSVHVFTHLALTVRLNWTLKVIEIIYIISNWSYNVFLTAMQAILLMRVVALCNRSKAVLVFLSACFFCQTTVVVAISAKQFNFSFVRQSILSFGPAIGSVVQAIDMDYSIFGPLPAVQTVVQLAFDMVLFGFALFAFSRHAVEARALAGGWSVNPLVKLLAADQTLYFLCYALYQALTIPESLPSCSNAQYETLDIWSNVLFALIVIFGPRMVVRLRAEELRSREGTLQDELSTIQFGSGDPSVLPSVTGEEGGELETVLGGDSLENRVG